MGPGCRRRRWGTVEKRSAGRVGRAVVVLDAGHPIGILTRSDLLGFLVGPARAGLGGQ